MSQPETNPWDEDPSPAAMADTPFAGLGWEVIHDIAAAPTRAQSTIVRLASVLVQEPSRASTPLAMAGRLKVTEVAILEAVSRMPTLFRLSAGGHRLTLLAPGEDPTVESPRMLKAKADLAAKQQRTQAKAAIQEAHDDEDTPWNAIRRSIEECGVTRAEARGFTAQLLKIYDEKIVREAVAITKEAAAADPKSYIFAICKRSVANATTTKPPRKTPAYLRPSGRRETVQIGWSADRTEPRKMLYRMPDGTTKASCRRPGLSHHRSPKIRVSR